MPATSMLSSVQKALRNLLIGDDERRLLLRQAPIDQFSSDPPPSLTHLPPDRIAFVSCEFLLLQEVPETG